MRCCEFAVSMSRRLYPGSRSQKTAARERIDNLATYTQAEVSGLLLLILALLTLALACLWRAGPLLALALKNLNKAFVLALKPLATTSMTIALVPNFCAATIDDV